MNQIIRDCLAGEADREAGPDPLAFGQFLYSHGPCKVNKRVSDLTTGEIEGSLSGNKERSSHTGRYNMYEGEGVGSNCCKRRKGVPYEGDIATWKRGDIAYGHFAATCLHKSHIFHGRKQCQSKVVKLLMVLSGRI